MATRTLEIQELANALRRNAPYSIHVSDVKAYLRCRRQWNWSSALRGNLEPKKTPIYFLQGRGIHWSLATYHETGEHPAEVYKRFMTQVLDEEEAAMGFLYRSIKQERADQMNIGIGMLNNYMDWVNSPERPDDVWETVATELDFSIPVLNPHGQVSSRIIFEGTLDGIMRHRESGTLWIREYKSIGREPNAEHLKNDLQNTLYAHAVQTLLGEPVAGVMYRFLRKSVPEPPERLKKGTFSKSKAQPTTYGRYMAALRDEAQSLIMAQKPEKVNDEASIRKVLAVLADDYSDFLTFLKEIGYSQYFTDIPIRKTPAELRNAAQEMWTVGLEMTHAGIDTYSSPDWFKCQYCSFREPCLAMNADADWQSQLDHGFVQRKKQTRLDTNGDD